MRATRSDKGVFKFSDRELIERHSIPEPNSGCWLWLADANDWGYGRVTKGRVERLAHRLSFNTFKAPIPDGGRVLHKCDVTFCVNPDHLFLGSLSDNVQDCIAKGRHVALRGSNHPHAKLTPVAAAEIRSSDIQYGDVSALARKHGVSRRAINFVRRGKTWAR